MKRRALLLILFAVIGIFFATKLVYAQIASSTALLQQIPTIDPNIAQEANRHTRHLAVCPKLADPTIAHCFAHVIINQDAVPFTTTKPAGFGPAEFRKAYNVTGKATGTPVVAIVDAYDQPNMLLDLQKYSTTFNLAQLTNCTGSIANSSVPCFKKVNQTGGTTYPQTDAGWALEISLDVEAVHAMCDNCSILLIEAKTASNVDLLKAFDTAVTLGATVISNSYGSDEVSTEIQYDTHFNQPGIGVFASSGDSGYGVSYPAASRYVIAVGGTKLTLTATGAYSSESAWTDGGSGCSNYETKQSWQTDSGCGKRTVADVAADANPTSGAAVYDTVTYNGKKGW